MVSRGRDRAGPQEDSRRQLLAGAGLAVILVIAYPLLLASGAYDNDHLSTYYVLVAAALACHLADWWDGQAPRQVAVRPSGPRGAGPVTPGAAVARWRRRLHWPVPEPGERPLGTLPFSATDLMRGLVLFLTAFFLLLGLLELLAGLGGQSGTSTGGVALSASDQAAGGALLAGGCGIALALQLGGTGRVPGFRRLRPGRPISWFAVLVVMLSFAQLLSPTSGRESVASTIQHTTTAADLVLGSLPFGVIALLAVGPLVARTPRQMADRLGLWPLRPAWWLVGIAAGFLLVPAVDSVFTPLQDHLLPHDCIVQQTQVQQSLAGGDAGRGWVANAAIALFAGLDEELLFRGVILPRFGLVISSLLFGAFHLQYTCHGLPGVGDLEIVVLGVVFGLLFLAGGLPAAILGHASYDASILLDRVVPGAGGWALVPVLALLLWTAWRRRRLVARAPAGAAATPG